MRCISDGTFPRRFVGRSSGVDGLSGALPAGFDNGEDLPDGGEVDGLVWIQGIEGVNSYKVLRHVMGDDAFEEYSFIMDDDEVTAVDMQFVFMPEVCLDFTTYQYFTRFVTVFSSIIHRIATDFEGEPIACHLTVGNEVDDGKGFNVFGISISREVASIGIFGYERNADTLSDGW